MRVYKGLLGEIIMRVMLICCLFGLLGCASTEDEDVEKKIQDWHFKDSLIARVIRYHRAILDGDKEKATNFIHPYLRGYAVPILELVVNELVDKYVLVSVNRLKIDAQLKVGIVEIVLSTFARDPIGREKDEPTPLKVYFLQFWIKDKDKWYLTTPGEEHGVWKKHIFTYLIEDTLQGEISLLSSDVPSEEKERMKAKTEEFLKSLRDRLLAVSEKPEFKDMFQIPEDGR